MNIKIENAIVGTTIEMLFEMPLKGKKSRHRTKFIQFLNEHSESLGESEKQLMEDYVKKDEDGNWIASEDGKSYYVDNKEEYAKEVNELLMEKAVFGGDENQETIKVVRQILHECDQDFSGYEATVYNHLCDLFEVDELDELQHQEENEEV